MKQRNRRVALVVLVAVASVPAYRCGSDTWETTQRGPVKDIRPGPEGSRPGGFIRAGSLFFFPADDGAHGVELWATDGTEAGTRLVKDIYTGTELVNGEPMSSSYPNWLTAVGNVLYFVAKQQDVGSELWRTDGTAEGTVLVKDIEPGPDRSSFPGYLTEINGTLLFVARSAQYGEELWRSDGTSEGTALVKDVNPGIGNGFYSGLVQLNGIAYFLANEPATGKELWRSDGTAQGTYVAAETWPGPEPVSSAVAIGPALQPPPPGRRVCCLMKADNLLYFIADGIWRSDGTKEGTFLVSPTSYPALFAASGSRLFFAEYEELWLTDGTAQGTRMVHGLDLPAFPDGRGAASSFPTEAAVSGGRYYVVAQDLDSKRRGLEDYELWRSDGTAAGTSLVKDLRPGRVSAMPNSLTPWGDSLLFIADDGGGEQIWLTDGSSAGTVRLTHDAGRPSDECTGFLCAFGIGDDQFLYTGTDLEHGAEPWLYRRPAP